MSQSMNRFKLKPISAALLAALAAPLTGQAEEQVQDAQTLSAAEAPLPEVEVRGQGDTNDYNAGVTSTGAKTPTAIRDVPQSVTVINRAVLDAQGATTLTDALRNVPGITLGAGEGGVIGDNINLRGFSARTDLFLDGMRDRGQYARETFFLESIEVLKGPSSMLFGRGSTGGVINQASKQASLREHTEASIGVGTEAYYRATVDVNRPMSETSAFRVAALAHTNESTRDVIEVERYGVAPSLRFGIGTPTQVTVSSVHQRSKEIPDYGFPFPTGTEENPSKPIDQDVDNFYGFTDDKFDQDVDILGVRVEHKFSPALSIRNQTQYSRARIHAAPTVINGDTGARNRRERKIDDASLYNQTDVIAKFDTGAVKHTLVTGIEIGRDSHENQSYTWANQPPQDLDDPIYGPMPSTATRVKNTFTDNVSETLAVYANDTLELNPHWKLVGGVRWDRFEIESTVTDNTGTVTADLAQTDRMTSVRAGVIYQPDDKQSYYVSYGTSFNPSAETVTLSLTNDGVEPEENRSVEVGGKWDVVGGKLLLTASVFRVEKTNARETVSPGEVDLVGHTRVDGYELSAVGRLTDNWQVFAGYTFLDGQIVKSVVTTTEGNVLSNTPEHSASLWTTYIFSGSWEVGGGAVYASERFTNNDNTRLIDGYVRYDATVAYKQKAYDLRLNLLNLADEEYFEAGSGRATPAKGRSAVGTLTYRF